MENLAVVVWGNVENIHTSAVSSFELIADAITNEVDAADVNIREMINSG